MKKIENFEAVEELKEFPTLKKGPQIVKIKDVLNDEEKEYLKIEFDIASGDLAGYFTDIHDKFGGYYKGKLYRSYKPSAVSYFKAFITAVEESNDGYNWDWDEKSLIGKVVVVNFREEEYVLDGERKVSIKPFEFRSVKAYIDGKVNDSPERLTLEKQNITPPEENVTVISPEEEEKLPF